MRLLVLLFLVAFSQLLTAAEPEAISSRPHQVGYRRTELRYTTADGAERRRQLDLWYPTSDREVKHHYLGQQGMAAKNGAVEKGAHPFIVFSHGYLGASDQSIFLTESLARSGYIVASMNHGDAILNIFKRDEKKERPRFADFDSWSDEKFRDRRDDIVALLDQFATWNKSDETWKGHLDEQRIGGLGHSLGGYTLLGMAGGWKSWREPRLKTVVLLSPYAQPFPIHGELEKVTIPVMLQGGTLDLGITPFLGPVYRKLGGPKCFLIFEKETHIGWTNFIALGKTTSEAIADGNGELMNRFTTAFFDQYLWGSDRSKILEAKEPRLSSIQLELNNKAK